MFDFNFLNNVKLQRNRIRAAFQSSESGGSTDHLADKVGWKSVCSSRVRMRAKRLVKEIVPGTGLSSKTLISIWSYLINAFIHFTTKI